MQRNVTAERVQTQLKTCCLALDQITHGSTMAIELGSQACCLANDSSDIDILLCVHGLDSQCCPKAKESQKEYAKDLLECMHHLLRLELRTWQRMHPGELSQIEEQKDKQTFRCTVNGLFVDIGYDVARGRQHSYQRYADVLRDSVTSSSFPKQENWMDILAMARAQGLVQESGGGTRGTKLN